MHNALCWSDFDIEGEIGRGQAGVVLRARLRRAVGELKRGETVAIKRYKGWIIEEPGQFERIFRELETGRKIIHENLISIVGITADDVGRPALVMKYYEGESLQAFLERHRSENKSVNSDCSMTVLADLAGALCTLHAAGIVHRDVKPANILLTANGAVLMDLGVVTSRDFGQETTTPEFLGTLRYAAPEYLFGKTYDTRADLFSFGAIAYELLMDTEFDGDVQHWAELVAKRRIQYSFRWDAAQRAMLTERLGLNLLEFFISLLDSTLVSSDSRILDLSALEVAIDGRFWEQQFHFEEGKCALGPPLFHPLGKFNTKPGDVSITAVAQEICRKLSAEERLLLKQLLKEHCWERDWWVHDWRVSAPFVKAGILGEKYITEFQTANFHAAVRYAYRYDMF